MDRKESEVFRVEEPLVLRKKLSEHIKFLIKDGLMLLGVDRKDWGSYRKQYYKPGQMDASLSVSRLDKEALAQILERSNRTLKSYKRVLSQVPDDELHLEIQYQTVPLIRSVLNMESKHNRAIDIGACYARIDRLLAEEYPAVYWDLVDFPTTLEEENQDIKLDNMVFHSAYPLEFLEKTDRQYDVAIFNRTLAVMSRVANRRIFEGVEEQSKIHCIRRALQD
jgi:hypothetical protein